MSHPHSLPVEGFSRNAVQLELFFGEQSLAKGSGLLARRADHRPYLITALHNFTGREPDGICKAGHVGIPNFVEITSYHYQRRLPLYADENDPNSSKAEYWWHPLGAQLDVCVMPLPDRIDAASLLDHSFLDPAGWAQSVPLSIAQQCFIVGYPEGLAHVIGAGRVLPIWKVGYIASEPSYYFDGVPKLLIDAATREGMSGSPVFVRLPNRHRLLGIYTGRTSTTSDLGFVFSPEAILPIFESRGTHCRPLYAS